MSNSSMKRMAKSGLTRLRFTPLGACGTVTGSFGDFEWIESADAHRFFVDCGLDMQNPQVNYTNRLPLGVKACDYEAGVFTHAHGDHILDLPTQIKAGLKANVHATHPTKDLAQIALPDSGFIQEREAQRPFRGKRGAGKSIAKAAKQEGKDTEKVRRNRRPVEPLYTYEEAVQSLDCIVGHEFNAPFKPIPGAQITAEFLYASHLLGAAMVKLTFGKGTQKRKVLVTGDLGRPGQQLMPEVAEVGDVDHIIIESTYGDRDHLVRDRRTAFAELVNAALKRAVDRKHPKFGFGKVFIAGFSMQRVQCLLNDLRFLMENGKVPNVKVYLDTPMGIATSKAFLKNGKHLSAEIRAELEAGKDPFRTPQYFEVESAEQSIALEEPQNEPIIIISSSGMLNGGRILHHLQAGLPHERNTLILTGFQSEGTLGRALLNKSAAFSADNAKDSDISVQVAGQEVDVRAVVDFIPDFSGHGDRRDLLNFLKQFKKKPPRKVILVHGENKARLAFKELIRQELGWNNVVIPNVREAIELD